MAAAMEARVNQGASDEQAAVRIAMSMDERFSKRIIERTVLAILEARKAK
jgi:hypothetical protein